LIRSISKTQAVLSLSFKDVVGELITNIKATRTRLPSFFSNLLPEGGLRDYLAAQTSMNPQHEFFLLWLLGQDLPGALTIKAMNCDELPFDVNMTKLKYDLKTP